MTPQTVMANIYAFKHDFLIKKSAAASDPMTLRRRKATTLRNEAVKQQLVNQFDQFPIYIQPSKFLEYCVKFADVTSKPTQFATLPDSDDSDDSE